MARPPCASIPISSAMLRHSATDMTDVVSSR
jgi:hypothetical protein